jgi:hypothetical protein
MADDIMDLSGCVATTVKLRSGSALGVTIRQLRFRELPKLAECIGDEAAMLKLCTSLTDGEIDEIGLEDAERLVGECERMNMDFFQRWLERQLRRNEAVVPGVRQKIAAAVESALPTTSPRSGSA